MFDELSRLQGLMALSGSRGMDIRPTLLRVLTDLFVKEGHRSQADSARFAELAAHLVDAVDEDTRMVVAGKLGPCPAAPRAVLDKLLAAEPAVAALVIAASPILDRDDLWTLATDGGPVGTAALARRRDLDGELVRFLARKEEPLIAEALVANRFAPLDRESVAALAGIQPMLRGLAAQLAARADVNPVWLGPWFMALGSPARRWVAEAVAADAGPRPLARESHVSVNPALLAALEQAALTGDTDSVGQCLALAFGIGEAAARRLVADQGGEPFAVALAGLGLPLSEASRLLLVTQTRARQSIEALRELVAVVDAMPRAAAARLIRVAAAAAAPGAGRHRPVFADTAPVRSGAAPVSVASRRQDAGQGRQSGDAGS